MRPPPSLNDRFLLALSVFLFGLGLAGIAQSEWGVSYFSFALAGLCLASYR